MPVITNTGSHGAYNGEQEGRRPYVPCSPGSLLN